MALTGWRHADPIVSILIGIAVIWASLRLIRESVDILLEATPVGIDAEAVAARLGEIPGVLAVHDLHVWSITSGMPALSCHLVVAADRLGPGRSDDVLNDAKAALKDRFGIEHSTLQVESESYDEVGEVHDH